MCHVIITLNTKPLFFECLTCCFDLGFLNLLLPALVHVDCWSSDPCLHLDFESRLHYSSNGWHSSEPQHRLYQWQPIYLPHHSLPIQKSILVAWLVAKVSCYNVYSTLWVKKGFQIIKRFISLLSNKVPAWFMPIWSQGGEHITSYECFLQFFKRVFDHLREGKEILTLNEGTQNAAEFALSLHTLATGSGWNERALKTPYCQSLNAELLTELACHVSKHLLTCLLT